MITNMYYFTYIYLGDLKKYVPSMGVKGVTVLLQIIEPPHDEEITLLLEMFG